MAKRLLKPKVDQGQVKGRDPDCTRCKLHETAEYVCLLGYGNRTSDVMIIGEAPGKREDDSGRPFVGTSGKLLRKILERNGFKDDVYITNAVSCRPPGNRTPKATEIKSCKYWLDRQIKAVKPEYVLLLGNVPLLSVLGVKGITSYRGKPVELDDITYFPTFHPASTFHDPSKQKMIETDIQSFREIVKNGGAPKEKKVKHTIVENEGDIIDMLDDLKGCVSFDIETTCLYPWDEDAKVRAIGFGTKRHQWCVYTDDWSKGQLKRIIRKIDKRLRNCMIAAQNGKFDSLWMRVHFDVRWDIDFDTMLAHYMLDENSRHGLKYLATAYFGASDYDLKAETAEREPLCEYLALDLLYTRKLRFVFGKMLKKEPFVKEVFEKILMPCARMFVDVEYNGVYINTDKMDDAEVYLRGELFQAKEKLNEYAIENPIPDKVGEMNWGSPQQVAYLLFEEFGLDVVERTKKGAASTSESVLKRIDHPLVESLLKYRGAKQQLSFFIDGWKPYLVDHRIHPSFKLHGTVTGRFSCEHPNLQQVPRDTRIRSLITAPPGWVFIDPDLSQIEMRIAAELSGCKNLLDAFYTGIDVHWKTAIREIARGAGKGELVMSTAKKYIKGYPYSTSAQVFLEVNQLKDMTYSIAIAMLEEMGHEIAISINKDWKEVRKKAKAINFGFLFGMWYKKFMIYARDNYGIKVTEAEAKAAFNAYFDLYPELKDWHKRQQNYARRNGYVTSLSGRKRRLPLAMSYNEKEYKPAMRQGINSPVQSFANELNLMAAIQIYEEFSWDEIRIVGTVHDETLMWVRINKVRTIVPRVLEIMSHPKLLDEMGIKIKVPIEADVSLGPWGEGVPLKQWLSESVKVA